LLRQQKQYTVVEILAFAIGSITILTSTGEADVGVWCGIIAIINIGKNKT
jgi:hypothetical protein